MGNQELGRWGGFLWIRFRGNIVQFPLDTEMSSCAKYYLESTDWTYTGGNGCGNTRGSRFFLSVLESIYDVDLTPVCNLHDLEYSLNESVNDGEVCVKTIRHRLRADSSLEYNIITYCREFGNDRAGVRTLAFIYMVGVRLFGRAAYWGGIPANKQH